MKEKILAAIKAKFPKVNLSKKRLDAIAAKIEGKVIDDETKIDAAIDDYNDYNPLEDIAKNDDKIRGLEAKTKPATPKEEDEPTQPKVEGDEPPAWAKQLMTDIASIKGEKVQTSIKQKAGELLKDVPAQLWNKRVMPEKDEDIEAFVEDVKNDFAAFTTTATENGLSIVPKPSTGAAPAKKEVVSTEVTQFIANQKEKQAQVAAVKA